MKQFLITILLMVPLVVLGQEAEAVTAHARDYLGIIEKVFALFGVGGALAMFVPPKIRAAIPVVNTILRVIRFEFMGQKNGAPDQPKAIEFG